jgi:peptide/nickel transport system substrate-binding protein
MPTARAGDRAFARPLARALALALAGAAWLAGCTRRPVCTGDYCGTLVIAAAGEPDILLPPVSDFAITRDVTEQLFLKLAELEPAGTTVGDQDFAPQLAARWEWDGPTTLAFHLDPRARWQDGRPVTAADVAFTFAVYTDTVINSPFRASLREIAAVTTRDSLTAVFRFRRRYPEMFYDAVYHMRILPAHLLRELPRERWRSAPFGRAPVGDGPYRFVAWKAGESIELGADSTFFLGRPHIRRVIWRFTPDQQVAVTQLLARDADAVEVLVTPDNVRRVRADPQLALYPYQGSAYGYLGFNLRAPGDSSAPHPLFGDRELRRALAMAVDRERLLRNAWGDLAALPPGPMSQLLWIWDPTVPTLPHDSAQAARLLARLGWTDADGDGIRERAGRPLAFRILLPTTSAIRRQYGRLLQEQFRAIGADVQLDEVDFGVFNRRAQRGDFDALLNTWNTDPTPSSGIPETWTRAGFGRLNYGRYANPEVDRLVEQAAVLATDRVQARRAWRAAIALLNQDAPAVFLFAPENVAAVHRRVENVVIQPDSWLARLRLWRIPADRLTERDRAEP